MNFERILTKNFGTPESHTLRAYEASGGYQTLRKALKTPPALLVEEVKNSGLRGRGGAGFPTGTKWSFLPKGLDKPVYLCVNADESEPGTFKDRELMERDPHMTIEGTIISSYAIGCHAAYVYIRGEFYEPYLKLKGALDEAYRAGYVGKNILGSGFDLEITIHRGAGAYICGEETALLESLEGKKGQPRLKPPFPAMVGLFGCPTIVNNVETIATVPWIVEHGATAYRAFGTEKSPGTKMFSVSGHVERPGNYEVPLGIPMMSLINDYAGGVRGGKKLKAVIPGGSSTPVLNAEEAARATLDYENLLSLGTFLGSGGLIVIDEDTCMVWALSILEDFYAHESCGQCTPCREGTGWIARVLRDLEAGRGKMADIDLLLSLGKNMMGNTICVFSDAAAMPLDSFIRKFRGEFEAHVHNGGCPQAGRSFLDEPARVAGGAR
ncbi:MAG: NADH-quinone oxidoreductase subunit NuoF [bacterium]